MGRYADRHNSATNTSTTGATSAATPIADVSIIENQRGKFKLQVCVRVCTSGVPKSMVAKGVQYWEPMVA